MRGIFFTEKKVPLSARGTVCVEESATEVRGVDLIPCLKFLITVTLL